MTLRARLTSMLLLTLVPLGLAVGCGLYCFMRSSLYARLDDALTARVEALAAATKQHGNQIEFDFEDAAMPQYQPRGGRDSSQTAYFEVWRVKNASVEGLIERSASLGTASLLGGSSTVPGDRAWNADLPGDVDVRVLARRFVPPDEHEDPRSETTRSPEPRPEGSFSDFGSVGERRGTQAAVLIVVAVSREAVDGPLEILTLGLLCAGAVLTGVGWLALRWAITQGLLPVGVLAEQVAAIDPVRLGVNAESTSSRLAVAHLPREIAPIQGRVNALLSRVEAAMHREKRFTTAAAHELRTPVAELRTLLEVAASRPRTAEEAKRTLSTSLVCVERLDRLVSTLLRLARIEAGREAIRHTPMSVLDLIERAIESVRAIAEARRVQFQLDVPRETIVIADKDLLGVALGNLIANAAEYADERSTVHVELVRAESGTVLRISNATAALATIDCARIGEPLWQPDQARVNSEHLGLGITLARSALAASGVRGSTLVTRVERAATPRFVVEMSFVEDEVIRCPMDHAAQ